MLGAMLTFGRLLFGGGRWAFVLALGGIWLYALLSGMSPSVTRAAIMGSIYLIGRLMGREGASLPALAAAAAVMAGLNPKLLGNISFQLSFTAVTALLLLAPPLERRFTAVVERFTGTEGPSSTFGRAVAVALAAGVAATIGTLPLVALAFERVSYLGIPATLLALPALPFILVGSATTAIAGLAWAPLGVLAGWATWVPLAYLLELVGIFARVFGGSFGIGGVTPTLLWAYYGVGIVLLFGGTRRHVAWNTTVKFALSLIKGRSTFTMPHFRWVALALVIASTVLWTAAMTSPDGRLTVIFLDVGQGDAIFIRTPNGQQVLVDGGPDPRVALRAIGDAMPFWDRSLDAVILTHPHADHLNGLVRVLERYDVDLVGEAKLVSGQSQYVALRKLITANVDTRIVMSEGQQLRTGDGVIITVLNPPSDLPAWTPDIINNGSVVLRVTFGTVSFLLTGDIEQEAEAAMLVRGVPLRSTVYKAPHHGSKTSTSQAFLDAVAPTMAVISVGEDNRFDHPDDIMVARLRNAVGEENVLLTLEHGDVQFTTDGVRLWLDSDR
jgi:competence protein ComEC